MATCATCGVDLGFTARGAEFHYCADHSVIRDQPYLTMDQVRVVRLTRRLEEATARVRATETDPRSSLLALFGPPPTDREVERVLRELDADKRTPEERAETDRRFNERFENAHLPICRFYGPGYACFHCGQERDDAVRILGILRARVKHPII